MPRLSHAARAQGKRCENAFRAALRRRDAAAFSEWN
jgi:hypothetical protein